MRVLIVIPSYKPAYVYGGPIYSVSRLAEALVQIGNDVTVYTTNANGLENLDVNTKKSSIINGVAVFYFRRWTRDHSNFSPSLLVKLIKTANSFDVIHIQSWWNLVAIPAALICLLKGKTPCISPRGSLTEFTVTHKMQLLKSTIHKWVGKRLLNKAVLFFSSFYEKRESTKLLESGKYCILPNVMDLYPPVQVRERLGEELRILFLGRIDPAKNLELIFDSLKGNLDFEYKWWIVGEGSESYIEECKERTKDVKEVEWLGPITGLAKLNLIASADILILPSHTENFGNVVIEALSQGTAVLLSPHVGAGEYVESHGLGFIIEDDPERWKSVFRSLARNKSPLADIRKRAPELIKRDFQPELVAQKYLDVYRHVV